MPHHLTASAAPVPMSTFRSPTPPPPKQQSAPEELEEPPR